jgi:hypothetical protein
MPLSAMPGGGTRPPTAPAHQRGAAGMQGGHAASTRASRRAAWCRGRPTPARRPRRAAPHAEVAARRGPQGHGARLAPSPRAPEGLPQSPGAPGAPPHNVTQLPGTASRVPRSPAAEPAHAPREPGATAGEARGEGLSRQRRWEHQGIGCRSPGTVEGKGPKRRRHAMHTLPRALEGWHTRPWPRLQRQGLTRPQRLDRATRRQAVRPVRTRQRLLRHAWSARLLALRHGT